MPSPRPLFLKRLGRRISDPALALALGLLSGFVLGFFI